MTPFEPGENVLLLDRKGRRYMITLRAHAQFHTHQGFIEHDALIGSEEGTVVRATSGAPFIALRPSLSDFILKMPRGAQVVYPKDIGTILLAADIRPGAYVLEAGTGSGALTLALLRAVGEQGTVISFEARPDHLERARANITAFLGKVPHQLDLRLGTVHDADVAGGVDRVVLDLPEPWGVVPLAAGVLRPGGVFCAYSPSTVQVSQTAEALRAAGFIEISTSETLVRTWHVEGESVRPDHRMVAHTGFITTARSIGGTGEIHAQ